MRPPAALQSKSHGLFLSLGSQKLPMKVLWKQSTFIFTTAPNPMCFGHNTRVRLGCGVRKCLLCSGVWQRRFAVCLCGWGCEAASSLAVRVSWLIFEPWSQKLPMKVLWKQSTFIFTTAPNPRCFGHNMRVRLGCGVRKCLLRADVRQRRFAICLWVLGCEAASSLALQVHLHNLFSTCEPTVPIVLVFLCSMIYTIINLISSGV